MPFTPIVPFGGLAGLRFIDRTYAAQFEKFTAAPDFQRDIAYFRENAAAADTVEAFIGDRQLMTVALGAFGLEGDVGKRAYIGKILEEGTFERTAFANRLAAPEYKKLSAEIGFGDFGYRLGRETVREEIITRYQARQFERAIGQSDVDLRLALNFRREIGEIAANDSADRVGWFNIMGSPPLRRVVEMAFNLPQQFGQIDIDRQKQELESKSRRLLGSESPAVFQDPEKVDEVLRRFLAIAQAQSGPGALTPGIAAVTILQSGGLGFGAQSNLFASNFL